MIKPGRNDKKVSLLIAGEQLSELKRFTWQMGEAFGLDTRIEKYQGKRPIGFYSWDLDCLLAVIDNVLKDDREYPDRDSSGYKALVALQERLQQEDRKAFGKK